METSLKEEAFKVARKRIDETVDFVMEQMRDAVEIDGSKTAEANADVVVEKFVAMVKELG